MAPKVKLLKLLRYSIAKVLTAAQLIHPGQEKKEDSEIMNLTAQLAALKEDAAKNAAKEVADKAAASSAAAAKKAAADDAAAKKVVVMALQNEVDALKFAAVVKDPAAKQAWQILQQTAVGLAKEAAAAEEKAENASFFSKKKPQKEAERVQAMANEAKYKADQAPFKIATDKVAAADKVAADKVAAARPPIPKP